MNIPLEIYVYLINFTLVFILFLWMFYITTLKKYKNVFIWIAILFIINLLNIRFIINNYLKNKNIEGERGLQGSQGIPGNIGSNKCCGNFPDDKNDIEKINNFKKSVNKWTTLLLSYKEGTNFLTNYFFIDYSWKDLLEKPNETINPFNIIETDPNWNL
jgi:hypothetical protein